MGDLIEEFRKVIVALRPHADVGLIGRACDVAARCHQGQIRLSGHPDITHPVAVWCSGRVDYCAQVRL